MKIEDIEIGDIMYSCIVDRWVIAKKSRKNVYMGNCECASSCPFCYLGINYCPFVGSEIFLKAIPILEMDKIELMKVGSVFISSHQIYILIRGTYLYEDLLVPVKIGSTEDKNKTYKTKQDMKDGTVRLSIEKAREYYNGNDSSLKEIALQAYDEKDLAEDSWSKRFLGKRMSGYIMQNENFAIEQISNSATFSCSGWFKTRGQAESSRAYAKITQLMAEEDYNGAWVPDWDSFDSKYCIERNENEIVGTDRAAAVSKLAFKNEEVRDRFLNNFNYLLKQYFEID